ncbi:MAG TPA: hypothetical protein VGI86_19940 [Acidimicrobiia bacterium]|jgi:hypothetical protein
MSAAGHDECYRCPVGAFFAEAQAAQPEAMEHMLNAAYELLEVARVAIDAAERAIDEQRATVAAQRADTRPEESAATEGSHGDAEPVVARRRIRRIDIA